MKQVYVTLMDGTVMVFQPSTPEDWIQDGPVLLIQESGRRFYFPMCNVAFIRADYEEAANDSDS